MIWRAGLAVRRFAFLSSSLVFEVSSTLLGSLEHVTTAQGSLEMVLAMAGRLRRRSGREGRSLPPFNGRLCMFGGCSGNPYMTI